MYLKSNDQTLKDLADDMEDNDDFRLDMNDDYLKQMDVALESLDLHQRALDMIDAKEDKIENPEWLKVTSSIDEFPDTFPSMEDNEGVSLYQKIKERILKLLSWLGNIIASAFNALIEYIRSMNIKADRLQKRLQQLDPNSFQVAHKLIAKSLVPLVTSNGKLIDGMGMRDVSRTFQYESLETFSSMENVLVQYRDRLNMFFNGAYPNVPQLDIFNVLRRTSNFKGSDERIVSEIKGIGYRVEIDKGEYGAVQAKFFLPTIMESMVYLELPNVNQTVLLYKACDGLLKISKRYAKDVYVSTSRLNRITADIKTIVNSKSPEDDTFQDTAQRLVRSRDFNQTALFSSIRTFIALTRFNLRVMNQVGVELVRICETASRKQEKVGGMIM